MPRIIKDLWVVFNVRYHAAKTQVDSIGFTICRTKKAGAQLPLSFNTGVMIVEPSLSIRAPLSDGLRSGLARLVDNARPCQIEAAK